MSTKWDYYVWSSFPFTEDQRFMLDGEDRFDELIKGSYIHGELSSPITADLDIQIKLPVPEDVSMRQLSRQVLALISKNPLGLMDNYFLYWIRTARRINNTVAYVTAHMDVLNSGDYAAKIFAADSGMISPRTMILREHRDRFVQKTTVIGPNLMCYKVDKVAEGISPRQYMSSRLKINETNSNYSFYLIYRTASSLTPDNISNPVSCFLVASEQLLVHSSALGNVRTLYPADLITDKYYYVTPLSTNGTAILTTSGMGSVAIGDEYPSGSHKYVYGFIFYKNGDGNITTSIIQTEDVTGGYELSLYPISNTEAYVTLTKVKGAYVYTQYTDNVRQAEVSGYLTSYNSGSINAVYCKSISDVDRTDARILKIIELPYSPTDFSITSSEWSFSGFSFDSSELVFKQNSVSAPFGHTINPAISGRIFNGLAVSVSFASTSSALTDLRKLKDPKLYSSEFSTHKIVYDTFSVETKAECFDNHSDDYIVEGYYFRPTSTINSNMAFKSVLADRASYADESDYGRYLLSTRNNELTVYSNDYVNYIRTGYNYDKKSKAISTSSSWIGAAGTIATAAIGATVNPAVGAAAAIGAVMTVKSAISTTIANENTMASKLVTLKNQSTSTSGTDDIDLLNYYSGNRLWVFEYRPSDEINSLLDDLFFYFGYSTNWMGVPDVHSRLRFNFIQASLVYTSAAYSIPYSVLDEIKTLAASGITALHEVSGRWDYDQKYENYETWMVPAA